MLTRNCAIQQLLNENDFNVRVTLYDPAKHSKNPALQKAAWLEAVRDSIGGGILNSHSSLYKVSLQNILGKEIASNITTGNNISDIIDDACKVPEPLRITISALNSASSRVWIIA